MSSIRKLKEREKKLIASSQEWKCKICCSILSAAYQIDHIIPFCLDGDDSISNLQALCPNCHSSKTQRENYRIYKYKKLCATMNQNLCWFCLEDLSETMLSHDCDFKLKDINTIPMKVQNNKIKQLDQFIYIEEKLSNMCISDNNTSNDVEMCDEDFKISPNDVEMCDDDAIQYKYNNTLHGKLQNVLEVKISVKHIFVNECISESHDLSIPVIADAINRATTGCENKYDTVEVEILMGKELGEEVPDELFDFVYEELPTQLNKKIFTTEDVKYVFVA
jgi:hypothetical protein